MQTLYKYKKNYYSQNGEDGVTEEILRRLNIKKGCFVKIGAWNGKHLSNTYFLLERGWQGIAIEGGRQKFIDLKKRQENSRVN